MFMADFGAQVVKIEPPKATGRDTRVFDVEPGKKSVVVDPADEAQWLAELIAGADICIVQDAQTFRPFGLSHEVLRARNAADRPRARAVWRTTPRLGGHESQALLAAAGGVAWRQSGTDGGPIDSVYPHLLYVQGCGRRHAVAALVERERSGWQMSRSTGSRH
jgi:crotonobetainyl-CoA:carnitine CoA-transferase CaiB-like acyl-CoA transferase